MPSSPIIPQFTPFMAPTPHQTEDTNAAPSAPADLHDHRGNGGKWERAFYQGAHDGLKELKPKYICMGSARSKAAFKAGYAVTSAVKGFGKVAMADEKGALHLPPPPPPALVLQAGLERASSSGSLTALLTRSTSGSSGNLTGLVRDSSGSLPSLVRGSSSDSLTGMVRSSSHGEDLARLPGRGLRRNASTSRLAASSTRLSALEVVSESQPAAHTTLIPPYESVTLQAPAQPATYQVDVTRGGSQPFGTQLEVQANGGHLNLQLPLQQMPAVIATARQASITLHNESFAPALATISGPLAE